MEHLPESSSILQEANMIISTQGLGWFENMEKGDSKEIPPIFQAFQNTEQSCSGSIVKEIRKSLKEEKGGVLIQGIFENYPGELYFALGIPE